MGSHKPLVIIKTRCSPRPGPLVPCCQASGTFRLGASDPLEVLPLLSKPEFHVHQERWGPTYSPKYSHSMAGCG